MKKKVIKPFSIEAWKNGAKVETKSGRSVRILCTDIKSAYSIVAATMCEDGEEAVTEYDTDGHFCEGREDNCDLVIVEEVEEPERWAEDMAALGDGWFIAQVGGVAGVNFIKDKRLNYRFNYHLFATEEQAKSALAMARISQLMEHDERYGGAITEEEWEGSFIKYTIERSHNVVTYSAHEGQYQFLAFHTAEQAHLFFSENERLVKDYLMID